jgi:hypothetical protein
MSIKIAVSLICIMVGLALASVWLAAKTGSSIFVDLGGLALFAGLGLIGYFEFREGAADDKSLPILTKVAVAILCGIGLWIAIILYRTFAY